MRLKVIDMKLKLAAALDFMYRILLDLQVLTVADPQCIDSPDGIFCDGCSRNFHICAKGVTYRFACPDEKVYNSEFGRCEDPSGVRACLQPTAIPVTSQDQLLVNDVGRCVCLGRLVLLVFPEFLGIKFRSELSVFIIS